MVNLSIIEFGVYGFITYFSLATLVLSTQIKQDETNIAALVRSVMFLPGIVCCGVLITAGVDISLDTVNTLTITNNTITTIFYEDTTTTNKFTLLNPIWASIHFIFFIVLIFYVIKQILMMLGIGKKKKTNNF